MVKAITFMLNASFLFVALAIGQIDYPFSATNGDSDILAYWYNIREDSIKLNYLNTTFHFSSSLQIYGKVPSSKFTVKAEVYMADGTKAYEKKFNIIPGRKTDSFTVEYNDGFFRLICPTEPLKDNPDRITVTIQSGKLNRIKEISCRYHRLYGKVTDFEGKPFKGSIAVCPEDFLTIRGIGIKCSDSGEYDIELPERTYNAIICFDEMYGIKTCEVWAWHIIMDSDQKLDFKVGTGEVYNLHVWPNNGGGNTYFISFRPMVLSLSGNMKEYPRHQIKLNGKQFEVMDLSPELTKENIMVRINGKNVKIISMQKYYETGKINSALPAYLIQASKEGLNRTGKHTLSLEFECILESKKAKAKRQSMGYYQFYLNYNGLSQYW